MNHPVMMPLLLAMYFAAALLASVAWGRRGAAIATAAAPVGAFLMTLISALSAKPADATLWPFGSGHHLLIAPVVGQMFWGTCVWLLAIVPGAITGFAVRAIMNRGRDNKKRLLDTFS